VCTPADTVGLDDCMLVAITGEPHRDNRPLGDPRRNLSIREREGWEHVGALARYFSELVRSRQLDELHPVMAEERALWCSLAGEQASSRVKALLETADRLKVGARFAGVPSGGAVWAIGTASRIRSLKPVWQTDTAGWAGAYVRSVNVARGLEISYE
jgi:hypothetical protein